MVVVDCLGPMGNNSGALALTELTIGRCCHSTLSRPWSAGVPNSLPFWREHIFTAFGKKSTAFGNPQSLVSSCLIACETAWPIFYGARICIGVMNLHIGHEG